MGGAAAKRSDSALVFVACVLAYSLLGQRTMYGVDAWNDLRQLAEGDTRSAVHLLYKPLAGLAAELGGHIGLSLHDSVRALSAIGAAAGVACGHAASRALGLDRGAALRVAALIASAPAVAFYATVVERHGLFLGFAGAASWVTARWVRSGGGLGWSLGFGLAMAAAYAAHSTGVLMLSLLLPLFVLERRRRGGGWATPAAIGLVATILGVYAVSRVGIAVGHTSRAGGNFEAFVEYATSSISRPGRLLPCAWVEFMWPLMPLSLLWLRAFWRSELRAFASACAIGVAVHTGFAFLILGGFDFGERGAYAVGLAWPLAHLVTAAWSARIAIGAALVALVVAVVQIRIHDVQPHAEIAEQIREFGTDDGAPPVLLPVVRSDFEMLFIEFPEAEYLVDYFDLFLAAHDGSPGALQQVPSALPAVLTSVAGARPILISQEGERYLAAPVRAPQPELGPAILSELHAAFRFVDRDLPGWRFVTVP